MSLFKKEVPFISIGNGELKGNIKLEKGTLITCPHCGGSHSVGLGKSSKFVDGELTPEVETNAIQFYSCGKKTYMCGMDGTALNGIRLAEQV